MKFLREVFPKRPLSDLDMIRLRQQRANARKRGNPQPALIDATSVGLTSGRKTIYHLHHIDHPPFYNIVETTQRRERLDKLRAGFLDARNKTELPNGIIQFDRHPYEEWADSLDDLVIHIKSNVTQVLPDRLSYYGMTIISERCRAVFDQVDPDAGHLYLPMSVKDTVGASIGGQWYYMFTNRVFSAHKTRHTSGILTSLGRWDPLHERVLATPERCAFFADMPIWEGIAGNGPEYLSAEVFHAVKAAGLGGFHERLETGDRDRISYGEGVADVAFLRNVSHIWL